MSYNDALMKCASLCAKAEHSRVELIGKMCKWGIQKDIARLVISRLEEDGYINDERFAHAFVYDKFNISCWGRNKIRYYLRINGIDDNVADEAMAGIDGEEYVATLKRILSAKKSTLSEKDPYKIKMALCKYAVSRGFEASLASKTVNGMIAGGDDIEPYE